MIQSEDFEVLSNERAIKQSNVYLILSLDYLSRWKKIYNPVIINYRIKLGNLNFLQI